MKTPILRFSTFVEKGGTWQPFKVEDLGKFLRGQTYSRNDVTGVCTDVLIIRSSNLQDAWYVDVSIDPQYVDIEVSDDQQLKKNDVVICTANGSTKLVGKASIYDGEYKGRISWGAFCAVFRPSNELSKYFFSTNEYKKLINIHKQGGNGALANLNIQSISKEEIYFPVLEEEQQKIAAFFTALDEKITLTEKALALTERTTKVVLEKIYKGELRFKQSNGASFPDWQVRKLDQLLKFQNGINASKEQFGTGIKLISVKEVLSDVPVTYDSIASLVEVDDKEAKRFSVEYGDIVFQRSSETAEEAGSANVYLDSRPAVFGGFVIRGKKIADYHPQFMKMALRSKQVRRQIVRLAQGAQHVNIGQEQLSSVEVQLPCLAEQEKIAEMITNFEHKKATLLDRLSKLKRLKQAFMQQMFV